MTDTSTNTLLGWLGKETAPVKKVSPRSLSPILRAVVPTRVVLGVIGTGGKTDVSTFYTDILAPMIEVWGTPDEILLPSEGETAHLLQAWAHKQEIPVRLVATDWSKHGRRAVSLRDACIQREATHFLLLQGPRSNALSALAARLHRKRRPVLIRERPGQSLRGMDDSV